MLARVPIQVKCDVHSWMEAWIGAVDHPFFAITDASGAFAIPDLPKGDYEIAFFHPHLGTQTERVSVADSAATVIEANFKSQ